MLKMGSLVSLRVLLKSLSLIDIKIAFEFTKPKGKEG